MKCLSPSMSCRRHVGDARDPRQGRFGRRAPIRCKPGVNLVYTVSWGRFGGMHPSIDGGDTLLDPTGCSQPITAIRTIPIDGGGICPSVHMHQLPSVLMNEYS
jgi:hypothetical protein